MATAFAEWTRGYAVLQQYVCEQYDAADMDSPFPQMPQQGRVDLLIKFGFTADQASQFIRHVLFKNTSRDIYDCPLRSFQTEILFFLAHPEEVQTFLKSCCQHLQTWERL